MKTKTDEEKPIHIKPSLYAFYFYDLKVIAKRYGYNLVLHGSMNRDLDLVAIPWVKEIGDYRTMIKEFADELGGIVMGQSEEQIHCFPHGRISQVINIRRSDINDPAIDLAYYLDISIILPPTQQVTAATEEMRKRVQELEAKISLAFSVLENTEELNMCNYNHELVRQLNDAFIEVYGILDTNTLPNQ